MSAKRQKSETTVEPDTENETEKELSEVKCPLSLFFNANSDVDSRNTLSTLPVETLLPFLEPKDVHTLSQVSKSANETVYHKTEMGQRLLKIEKLTIEEKLEDGRHFQASGRPDEVRHILESIYLKGLTRLEIFIFDKFEFFVYLYALKNMPSLQVLSFWSDRLKLDVNDFTALMQCLMCCKKLSSISINIQSIRFTKLTTQYWSNLTKTLNSSLKNVDLFGIDLDESIDENDAAQIFASLKNLECISLNICAKKIIDKQKRVSIVSSMCSNVPQKNLVRIRNEGRLCRQLSRSQELEILSSWLQQSLPKLESFWFCRRCPCQRWICGETDDFARLINAVATNPEMQVIRVAVSSTAEQKLVCDYIRKNTKISTVEFAYHPKFVKAVSFTKELATIHKLRDFAIREMTCGCRFCKSVEDREEAGGGGE